MIIIIGKNSNVSEGLADLLTQGHRIKFLEITKLTDPEISSDSLYDAKIVIINLFEIHESGLHLISKIRKLNPHLPIIALDTHQSQSISEYLLKNGVDVYLQLNSNGEELNSVIEKYLNR